MANAEPTTVDSAFLRPEFKKIKISIDNGCGACYTLDINDNHSHLGGAHGKNGETLSQA